MVRFEGVEGGRCPPAAVFAADTVLIVVDVAIAAIAFLQLLRIHGRSFGWTRQMVFHLMIGSYNVGYVIYFICSLVAACQRWRCWSHGCGFILMAYPQIFLLATFLLLLSFWTDLCHQASDDEEEDDDTSISQSLLEKSNTQPRLVHAQIRCCSFAEVRIGSRQKYVILVIVLTFLFMAAMALLLWFGRGKNPIDSSLMLQVYLYVFSAFIIILGIALAFYGGILFSKMRKVASLAAVSLVCFTSSSALALATSVHMLSFGHNDNFNYITGSVFVCLYFIVGSSVPSSCVLWSMREMPSRHVAEEPPQSRVITIVRDGPAAPPNPQWRTAVTNSQNRALKVSPI
ncbi:tobamovirus multiplication protein 3 isoform X2 [Phalaenopsis equestris]|uniref:tobamovirus multiplication protein 3 isoform X2 n=1 Tax=Phalaenopsis equestris TaxID=78828 RepID=UPI0009E35EF1|nr:tobamovirus multiplication protein 3 isoform X2 [Phalaenopsis equestris]